MVEDRAYGMHPRMGQTVTLSVSQVQDRRIVERIMETPGTFESRLCSTHHRMMRRYGTKGGGVCALTGVYFL